jgi:hypothetical protein
MKSLKLLTICLYIVTVEAGNNYGLDAYATLPDTVDYFKEWFLRYPYNECHTYEDPVCGEFKRCALVEHRPNKFIDDNHLFNPTVRF